MNQPTTAVPVLPVSDLTRSVAWYERLGFECRTTYDGYAIVAFDGAEVHLAAFDDAPPATESFSGAYLRVDDADAVFAHWTPMGARSIAPPADQPYGYRAGAEGVVLLEFRQSTAFDTKFHEKDPARFRAKAEASLAEAASPPTDAAREA